MTTETTTPATSARPRGWYIVHVQSGYEDRVHKTITQKIEVEKLQDRIFNVLIPTEDVVEVKKNKKKISKRKFFPGYVLMDMIVDEVTYWIVKGIPGVTGFLGDTDPTPLAAGGDRQDPRAHDDRRRGQAAPGRPVREGREHPHRRRPVPSLHRRRRGRQRGEGQDQGHGHDLRPPDARRARLPAGGEDLNAMAEPEILPPNGSDEGFAGIARAHGPREVPRRRRRDPGPARR